MAMVGEYRLIKKAIVNESYMLRDGETDDLSRYNSLRREEENYWNKMLYIFMRDYSNETSIVEAFERRFK